MRHSYVALAAAFLVVPLRPTSAGAQSTDDYWRALAAENEPTAVLAAAAPISVPAPIAESLRLFRVYELTADEGAARRARELLRRADVDAEHEAWRSLALAMVYARGPNSRMRIGDDLDAWFVDPNSLGSAWSLRMLRGLVAEHPDFRDAALELATWAIERDRPSVAAEANAALAVLPADAGVLLARASLQLLFENYDSAAALADAAARAGADRALAYHVRATALLQEPVTADDGVAAYFDGASALGVAGRRAYGRVLEPVLSEEDLATWRALPDDDARAWIETWWNRSAAHNGVTPAERLAAHYRRLQRARIDFPSNAPMSVLQIQALFGTGEDSRRYAMSLRGLMLVRHGDPLRVAEMEACLSNPWPGPGAGIICPGSPAQRLAMFQRAGRLVVGESFSPFARDLTFGHGVYAFRGRAGGVDVVFAASLPARSANALVEPDGDVAGFLSAILLPESGEPIRVDSAFRRDLPARLHAMAGENTALALLHARIENAPGDASYEYRMTLSDRARHAGTVVGGRVELPALDAFSLSDLVVAPIDAAGTMLRGRVVIALAPFRVYAPTETFALYYELYDLPEGTSYRTEVEIVPVRERLVDRLRGLVGREQGLRLRFDGTTPAPDPVLGVQEMRTVSLNGLEPGLWRLVVVVTDLDTDRSVRRETLIDVGPAQ